jgi:RNA polymerase sigma factor, sigma-70 family
MFFWKDDMRLLEALKAGNIKAFNECYTRYYANLVIYAVSILDDEGEAQDLVQDFFVTFWQQRLYNNINASLKRFLFISIKNRCINKMKRDETLQKRLKEIQVDAMHVLPMVDGLENQDITTELHRELSAGIEKVAETAPAARKVLEMAYFKGMRRQEIANAMGTSPHTVRNQLIRALKILRGHFSKNI